MGIGSTAGGGGLRKMEAARRRAASSATPAGLPLAPASARCRDRTRHVCVEVTFQLKEVTSTQTCGKNWKAFTFNWLFPPCPFQFPAVAAADGAGPGAFKPRLLDALAMPEPHRAAGRRRRRRGLLCERTDAATSAAGRAGTVSMISLRKNATFRQTRQAHFSSSLYYKSVKYGST